MWRHKHNKSTKIKHFLNEDVYVFFKFKIGEKEGWGIGKLIHSKYDEFNAIFIFQNVIDGSKPVNWDKDARSREFKYSYYITHDKAEGNIYSSLIQEFIEIPEDWAKGIIERGRRRKLYVEN